MIFILQGTALFFQQNASFLINSWYFIEDAARQILFGIIVLGCTSPYNNLHYNGIIKPYIN